MNIRALVAIKFRKGSKYENKEKGKHGLLYCPEMGLGGKLIFKGGLSLKGRPRVLEEGGTQAVSTRKDGSRGRGANPTNVGSSDNAHTLRMFSA